jgi:hypothetical protein
MRVSQRISKIMQKDMNKDNYSSENHGAPSDINLINRDQEIIIG